MHQSFSFTLKTSALLISAALSQSVWAVDSVCENADGCRYYLDHYSSNGKDIWYKDGTAITDQSESLNVTLKAGNYVSQGDKNVAENDIIRIRNGRNIDPSNVSAHLTVPEGTTFIITEKIPSVVQKMQSSLIKSLPTFLKMCGWC